MNEALERIKGKDFLQRSSIEKVIVTFWESADFNYSGNLAEAAATELAELAGLRAQNTDLLAAMWEIANDGIERSRNPITSLIARNAIARTEAAKRGTK